MPQQHQHNKHIDLGLSTYFDVKEQSHVIGVILIIVAVIQFFLTIWLPINNIETYLNIFSTVLCLCLLGSFFNYYYRIHNFGRTPNTMKIFKIITVFLILASLTKAGIAIYFLKGNLLSGDMMCLFYIGDIVVWLAVAFFGIGYAKRLKIW